jgi:hypothetical protein
MGMSREELFPNLPFSSMEAMRVVGASLIVTQTQRLVDRAGYGLTSRVYGLNGPFANTVSKAVIINSNYKDDANFSTASEDEHLRMIYAPADFSDLHMKPMDQEDHQDGGRYPCIQGFVTGYGSSVTSITFEFNLVVEFIPKPIIYQIVDRKVAYVNSKELARAENTAARVDTGITKPHLEMMKSVAELSRGEIRSLAHNLTRAGKGEASNFLQTIRDFGKTGLNMLPGIARAVTAISPFLLGRSVYPKSISEAERSVKNDENNKMADNKKEYIAVRRM